MADPEQPGELAAVGVVYDGHGMARVDPLPLIADFPTLLEW